MVIFCCKCENAPDEAELSAVPPKAASSYSAAPKEEDGDQIYEYDQRWNMETDDAEGWYDDGYYYDEDGQEYGEGYEEDENWDYGGKESHGNGIENGGHGQHVPAEQHRVEAAGDPIGHDHEHSHNTLIQQDFPDGWGDSPVPEKYPGGFSPAGGVDPGGAAALATEAKDDVPASKRSFSVEQVGAGLYKISLEKVGAKNPNLGMNFSKTGPVVITKVEDGLVGEWNAANPSITVNTGDEIISVNGRNGRNGILLAIVRAPSLEIVLKKRA